MFSDPANLPKGISRAGFCFQERKVSVNNPHHSISERDKTLPPSLHQYSLWSHIDKIYIFLYGRTSSFFLDEMAIAQILTNLHMEKAWLVFFIAFLKIGKKCYEKISDLR